MNNKLVLMMITLSALALGGCVGYPVDYAMEIRSSPDAVSCTGCGNFLDVTLSWKGPNLDLELVTPDGSLVYASYFVISGCSHLGDDRGGMSGGTEEIICNTPDWGTYDVRIVNDSDLWTTVTVTIQNFKDDGIHQTISESSRNLDATPWTTTVISTHID